MAWTYVLCSDSQSDPTLCSRIDGSPPGTSVQKILLTRILKWGATPEDIPTPECLSNPGIKPVSLISPALAGGFFTTGITWEAWTYMLFLLKMLKILTGGLYVCLKFTTWWAFFKGFKAEVSCFIEKKKFISINEPWAVAFAHTWRVWELSKGREEEVQDVHLLCYSSKCGISLPLWAIPDVTKSR